MKNNKNNARSYNNYKKLDTNLNHYKDNQHMKKYDFNPGVSITFIDGSKFKTKGLTVHDIEVALHDKKQRWIELPNGSEINLGYVIHFEPYKFFKD